MKRFLRPLAAGFRYGAELRRRAYRLGWFESRRLGRPVVSVGNLSVGGTGKTPLVAWIAQVLRNNGLTPCVLTRGYGRRSGNTLVVIDPEEKRNPDPQEVGDEPALLAKTLPEVPMVVSPDRFRAGQIAEERFQVDVHILDDGFQRLSLARDLDIVLLDVTQELSDRSVLPTGRLREGPRALKWADVIILTRAELADPGPVERYVRSVNRDVKVFHASTRLVGIADAASGEIRPPASLQNEPVFAFCGLGNPEAFFASLRKWNFSVVGRKCFRDHHAYGASDLDLLSRLGREAKASACVTTEKDAMKLAVTKRQANAMPILVCSIQAEVHEADAFEDALLAAVHRRRVMT